MNKFQHHISFQKSRFDVYINGPRPSVLSNLLCNISVASSLLIFLDPELLYPRADIFFCVFSQKLKRVWDSVTREQKELEQRWRQQEQEQQWWQQAMCHDFKRRCGISEERRTTLPHLSMNEAVVCFTDQAATWICC